MNYLKHDHNTNNLQNLKKGNLPVTLNYNVNYPRIKYKRPRNSSMKSLKCGFPKKNKVMDYTNYAYTEAIGRLKIMLAAESYSTSKLPTAYNRHGNEDSTDNYSDNTSVMDRNVRSDILKYLSQNQNVRLNTYRSKKHYDINSLAKENIIPPTTSVLSNKLVSNKTEPITSNDDIFTFIGKQEDYIEQLEKESKYCRNELTNLLSKVKDVINENEHLTETARSELASLSDINKVTALSSDSDEHIEILRKSRNTKAPNIVYEAKISELEAELMQSNIDLKQLKNENDDFKQKSYHHRDLGSLASASKCLNCDRYQKQIENLHLEKNTLEDSVKNLQKCLDEVKSQEYNISSKRHINDLMQMERSQSELEIRHLRDELERQHERVKELQHEMVRRLAEERAIGERRYNNQVDLLGDDLTNQFEHVAKLQIELERQKRFEADFKRDLTNRNSQIEDLKMELRSNRTTFLSDIAQANAEKQSMEQEITALRLQLDRATREAKTDTARYNAEINSLRQRLDRGDADLLHSKREALRLNDEISALEKEVAYSDIKHELRPTKKDLDKRISDLQDKHSETVTELEDMIKSQKELTDKLTRECKMLTNKLEDTTLKHKQDKQNLRQTNEKLLDRLKQIWANYKEISSRRYSIGSSQSPSEMSQNSEEYVNQLPKTDKDTSQLLEKQNPSMIYRSHPPITIYPQAELQCWIPSHQNLPKEKSKKQLTPSPIQRINQLELMTCMTINPTIITKPVAMTQKQSSVKTEKTSYQIMDINPLITKSPKITTAPISSVTTTPFPMNQKQLNQTWTHLSEINTAPTTGALKITTKNSTEPMFTKVMNNKHTKIHNHMMNQSTEKLGEMDMEITLPIAPTTLQQYTHKNKSAKLKVAPQPMLMKTSKCRYHQQCLLMSADLADLQHQKAVLNYERAVALWGQQVQLDQSQVKNLCRNSLPRQSEKSKCNTKENFDSSQLEFSISSPSLMRSDSPMSIINGNDCFDDATFLEMTSAGNTTYEVAVEKCYSSTNLYEEHVSEKLV